MSSPCPGKIERGNRNSVSSVKRTLSRTSARRCCAGGRWKAAAQAVERSGCSTGWRSCPTGCWAGAPVAVHHGRCRWAAVRRHPQVQVQPAPGSGRWPRCRGAGAVDRKPRPAACGRGGGAAVAGAQCLRPLAGTTFARGGGRDHPCRTASSTSSATPRSAGHQIQRTDGTAGKYPIGGAESGADKLTLPREMVMGAEAHVLTIPRCLGTVRNRPYDLSYVKVAARPAVRRVALITYTQPLRPSRAPSTSPPPIRGESTSTISGPRISSSGTADKLARFCAWDPPRTA